MLSVKGQRIGIVAHDAGAANHILAWIEKGLLDIGKISVCLSGPAESSFSKRSLNLHHCSLDELLTTTDCLISGTSWPATFEHDARCLASELDIYSIAVVDHWTNYEERFCLNDIKLLPDEIWVVDSYAAELASTLFPSILIKEQPNSFLEMQCEEIREHKSTFSSIKNNRNFGGANLNILYVMEPVPFSWDDSEQPAEILALEYFLLNRFRLFSDSQIDVVIRPHPLDKPGKYTPWLTKQAKAYIRVDDTLSLAESIAWSDVVVGCQTYAMVVALANEKRVISALPGHAPPCVLPHDGIIHLSQLEKNEIL